MAPPADYRGGSGYRVARGRPTLDPNTRRMAIFAGGIGGALLLLVGGWSLLGHRHAGVPVIEADSRPLRSKPENAGGLQVAGQNENILTGDTDGRAALAPAPEAPAPQKLREAALAAARPPLPRPVAAPPVQTIALSQPVEPKSKPAAVPVAAAKPAARSPQVQLAALTTEQAALAAWQRLEKRLPEVFGGRKPAVIKYEHDGKTLWRLRTGGFADPAQAASFCDRVKAKGESCTLATS